jgi:hypothetical protein
MIKLLNLSPHLAVILLIVSLCLVINLNCDKSTRSDFCWMSVDTLYSSGISIHDTSDVREAFEAYIAYVDTTSAEFPFEQNWSYLTSQPFHKWRGRFYWQVDHEVYSPNDDKWLLRRLVYVDENGVIVRPYGCI